MTMPMGPKAAEDYAKLDDDLKREFIRYPQTDIEALHNLDVVARQKARARAVQWYDEARANAWKQLLRLDLPARFANVHLPGLPAELQPKVLKYFDHFDDLAAQGIAPSFWGRARTFKTYATCLVLRFAHTMKVISTQFVDCGSTFLSLEQDRFSAATAAALESMQQVHLLALDDMTNVRERTWGADALSAVISARFNAGLPTIYNGNINLSLKPELERFATLYGPSVARRVFDGGGEYRLVTG